MTQTLKAIVPTLALAVLAGCATTGDKAYVDPNPFADYGPAMKTTAAQPLGSYWQQEHAAEIAAATTPEALGVYLASPEAASALLAKVGPAYTSDPMDLTRIAAVTQLVMAPEGASKTASVRQQAAPRELWVAALERALGTAPDEYRRAFFTDQLRWCGERDGNRR